MGFRHVSVMSQVSKKKMSRVRIVTKREADDVGSEHEAQSRTHEDQLAPHALATHTPHRPQRLTRSYATPRQGSWGGIKMIRKDIGKWNYGMDAQYIRSVVLHRVTCPQAHKNGFKKKRYKCVGLIWVQEESKCTRNSDMTASTIAMRQEIPNTQVTR